MVLLFKASTVGRLFDGCDESKATHKKERRLVPGEEGVSGALMMATRA